MGGRRGKGLVAVDRSFTKVRRVKALCDRHGFTDVDCIATDSRHLCSFSTSTVKQAYQAVANENGDDNGIEAADASAQLSDSDQEESALQGDETQMQDVWPPSYEAAFQKALKEHGADRYRSSKRIWKGVLTSIGRQNLSRPEICILRDQVTQRLRSYKDSQDGMTYNAAAFELGSFDRVLLDGPCSAMGQRPLLRWGKSLSDVRGHADYQRQFLRTA